MDNAVLIAIIGFISGVVSSLVTVIFLRRKNLAETKKIDAETEGIELDNAKKATVIWRELSEGQKEQIERQAEQIKKLELKVDDLQNDLETLTRNYKEQCSICEYKDYYEKRDK